MKKTNFTQAGGFPFTEATLDKMQVAYFEILKAMIGHFGLPDVGNFIISGCEIIGTNITSGIMYIDGDLCSFVSTAGNASTKISKIETIEDAPFETSGDLPTYYDYVAMINNDGVALSSFERLPKVAELVNELTNWGDIQNIPQVVIDPANLTITPPDKTVLQRIVELEKKTSIFTAGGVVFPWRKKLSEIPLGFQEVTDLRGKTVFGMDISVDPTTGAYINSEFAPLTTGQNDPKRNGGSKTFILEKGNLPNITIDTTKHGNKVAGDATGNDVLYLDTSGVNIGGNSNPVEALPPFQTVIFIEYVG